MISHGHLETLFLPREEILHMCLWKEKLKNLCMISMLVTLDQLRVVVASQDRWSLLALEKDRRCPTCDRELSLSLLDTSGKRSGGTYDEQYSKGETDARTQVCTTQNCQTSHTIHISQSAIDEAIPPERVLLPKTLSGSQG